MDIGLEMKKEIAFFRTLVESSPDALPFAEITVDGLLFKTGKPVTFPYLRNKVSSKTFVKGNQFQQDIEPAGRYMSYDSLPERDPNEGWEKGEVEVQNPLVLHWGKRYDDTSWKMALYKKYKKTGKELTKELIKQGYGAIITVDGKDLSEIVVLKASVTVTSPQESIDSIRNWD